MLSTTETSPGGVALDKTGFHFALRRPARSFSRFRARKAAGSGLNTRFRRSTTQTSRLTPNLHWLACNQGARYIERRTAARAAIEKALSSTTRRPKPRKRPKRGFYAAYADSSVPAPTPAPRRKKKPVAPSGNCPICYDRLTADATVFECSHAMCASCSDSYATAEVARSMSRRSGVSVTCPLCRAPSKVVLPEEMHTSLPL